MSSGAVSSALNFCLTKREPFSLVHFITMRCNARCSHCFIDFDTVSGREEELALDEIGLLTRSLGNSLYNVNITGGEPFLRKDLFEIVESYIVNAQVRSVVITTNGWFTEAIRTFGERFARLATPCRITISISIDNFAVQHDAGRGLTGLYDRALASWRCIEALNDPRISAEIAITVTPQNCGEVVPLFRHLSDAGISSIVPVLLREQGVMRRIPGKERVVAAYRELAGLCSRQASARAGGTASARLAGAVHRAKNRLLRPLLCSIAGSPPKANRCRAGSLFGTILSDGSVYPCELLGPAWQLGSLMEVGMDFLRIWRSPAADRARERITAGNCCCTFECAWTVNLLSQAAFWPRLAWYTLREFV